MLAACGAKPHDLASQLERDAVLAPLPGSTWDRVVVPPFRGLYDAYVAGFVGKPVHAPPFAVRAHFAGDPQLTLDEAVTRWIVPTLFGSQVVDGIDAVFVAEDDHFYALTGMAEVIARQLSPPCRDLLVRVGPPGRCGDAVWQFVVDSLRGNRGAAEHACSLAVALCGTRSP